MISPRRRIQYIILFLFCDDEETIQGSSTRSASQEVCAPAQHILLNRLPLYKGEDFVAIQKLGEEAFAPVHVYDRAAFIQAIKALGYTLWDQWAAGDHAMDLRGYPERSFPSFPGLCFVDSERM